MSLAVFLALPVAAQDSITIGYGAPELSGGQGVIMSGLVNAAEAKGWDVISSNANYDAEAQANQIDNFISQGVDAIVVVPVDSQATCSSVQRAQDAGIPFYTIDRAPLGCEINMTVQSDNYMAGQQAAEGVVALLTERYGEPTGTVLELQGDLGQNVAQLRGGGFNDHLANYENIEVISRPTEWRAEVFSQATLDVAASTELDAIYMHSDCVGAKVVTAALEQIGQLMERGEEGHIFPVGVDGCPDALSSIRAGHSRSSLQPAAAGLRHYHRLDQHGIARHDDRDRRCRTRMRALVTGQHHRLPIRVTCSTWQQPASTRVTSPVTLCGATKPNNGGCA